MRRLIIAMVGLGLVVTAGSVAAAEPPIPADQLAFFEKKIRPVLLAKCISCHGDAKSKGGLRLDSRDALRTGGDSGPPIVPGKPEASLLMANLNGKQTELYANATQMPPKEKLPADVIADFEKWVQMGAPDPRTAAAIKPNGEIDVAQGRQHWSFQPPKKEAAPVVKKATWPLSEIDKYVLAKLEEKKLTPAPDAEKRTLIRRTTYDLTGLPPTPDEVEAFLADSSPNAFEKLVDKLLASPRYGEKWGRHWLDVARYAESSGKEANTLYPFAWRYRDYVIGAFNADKPYDQFLREQLAGDLLPAKDDNEKAEHLIATGFLAIGPKSHNAPPQQFRLDLADEQIDAFSQSMLGLTVACARCHDHKFDPIPMKDYYALAGIFTSTETRFGTPGTLQARQSAPLVDLPAGANVPPGPSLAKREQDARKTQLESLKKQQDEAREEARKDRQLPIRLLFISSQIAVIEKTLSHYDADGNPKKLAMGAADRTFPRDSPIYERGEPNKPKASVKRGFLQVLSTGHDPQIKTGSGRKELADWVASKENPLTARVMANRVWQHLFGRGLVATPDNFGTTGQAPSHPELLDFLAIRFADHGWSVKKLVREVVLSRSYRMGSDHNAANAAVDPDNVYVWRMSKRRLDAEAIRDGMLAVAGQLDTTPPNGSPIAKFEGPVQVLQRFPGRFGGSPQDMYEVSTRSVYLPVIRDQVPEVLALFDFAEPSLVTGAREDTSVPAQGLFLLNNPSVMKLADKTAERLMAKYLSESERIDAAFRLAFGRPATASEVESAAKFVKSFAAAETKSFRSKATVEKSAWAAFAQALFAAAEFRYLD